MKNPPAIQEALVRSLGQEELPEKEQAAHSRILGASPVTQLVKNPPEMWEIWVRFLGWVDTLGQGTGTHYSILAWRIPWTEEPGGLQSTGSQRVGQN